MPTQFETVCVATEPTGIMRALCAASRRLCEIRSVWVALRCYGGEIGPPIPGGKGTRWFAPSYNDNQKWLPFSEYAPVELTGVYNSCHAELGDGFVLLYKQNSREEEVRFNINQPEEPSRVVAYAEYRKVEVPQNPFQEHNHCSPRPRPAAPSLARVGPSEIVPTISPQLCELLRHRAVQREIEENVERLFTTCLYLDIQTGALARGSGEILARVFRATHDAEPNTWAITIVVLGTDQHIILHVLDPEPEPGRIIWPSP